MNSYGLIERDEAESSSRVASRESESSVTLECSGSTEPSFDRGRNVISVARLGREESFLVSLLTTTRYQF